MELRLQRIGEAVIRAFRLALRLHAEGEFLIGIVCLPLDLLFDGDSIIPGQGVGDIDRPGVAALVICRLGIPGSISVHMAFQHRIVQRLAVGVLPRQIGALIAAVPIHGNVIGGHQLLLAVDNGEVHRLRPQEFLPLVSLPGDLALDVDIVRPDPGVSQDDLQMSVPVPGRLHRGGKARDRLGDGGVLIFVISTRVVVGILVVNAVKIIPACAVFELCRAPFRPGLGQRDRLKLRTVPIDLGIHRVGVDGGGVHVLPFRGDVDLHIALLQIQNGIGITHRAGKVVLLPIQDRVLIDPDPAVDLIRFDPDVISSR